ncbi:MAG: hypothetical protein NTV11_13325 [Rhodocyclales bacterium]|nr:hypothetical protein [Rhodocyclales bacterium]
MKGIGVSLALAFALTLGACGGNDLAPELQRGVVMVKLMTSPMRLSQSMYSAVQDGKPSTYVNFMFSTMGAAEWPDSEEAAERDPELKEQAAAGRLALAPKGVSFAANAPDPAKLRQIVLKADDAKGMLFIEVYDNPSARPLLVETIRLPKVEPAPGVIEKYSSRKDLGSE